jgi:hypothetical protein
MFKVSPASVQTFIDKPNCVLEDCVQYSTVRIPNVLCDGHLEIINCVGIVRIYRVLYCNHQLHREFLITLYNLASLYWGTYTMHRMLNTSWSRSLYATATKVT